MMLRRMLSSGVVGSCLFSAELAIVSLGREASGLGWYPIAVAIAGAVLGGVLALPAELGARIADRRGASYRLAAILRGERPVALLLLALIVLSHLHNLRVPDSAASTSRIVVWSAIPAAGILWFLAGRWRAAWGLASIGLPGVVAAFGTPAIGELELAHDWRQSAAPRISADDPLKRGERDGESPSLVILGLDGADWRYVNPLLEAGRLPHLAAVMSRGVSGTLINPDIDEHVSPVAWTSIFTGKIPETHGVTSWSSSPTSSARIWEMMGSSDPTGAVVMNVPGTFPVRAGPLFAMAGLPAPGVVSGTDDGWLVSSVPNRPLATQGPVRACPRASRRCPQGCLVQLRPDRFNLSGSSFRNSTPGILLTVLGTELRRWVGRSLLWLMPPVVELCSATGPDGTPSIWFPGSSKVVRVPEDGWTPWLVLQGSAERFVTRLRNVRSGPHSTELFAAPVAALEVEGLVSGKSDLPEVPLAAPLLSPAADAVDFVRGRDRDELITVNLEWLLAVEEGRLSAVDFLQRTRDLSTLVYVVGATDRLHHVLASGLANGRNPELVDETLDRLYEQADRWLGELLSDTNIEEAIVAVVSDHGSLPGHGKLNHHPEGIYVVTAPTICCPGARGPDLQHVDIVPILLAHRNRPLADDLAGTIPDELWPVGVEGQSLELPSAIASYDMASPSSPSGAHRDELSPEIEEQLRSLGYLE